MSKNSGFAVAEVPANLTLADLLKAKPKKNGIRKLAKKIETKPEPVVTDVVITQETSAAGDVLLVLKEPAYNHDFRGFCYWEVAQKGIKAWKWDKVRGVRLIPLADVALLMEGLKRAYSGKTLVMGKDKTIL